MTLRTLIVDDEPGARQRLRDLLTSAPRPRSWPRRPTCPEALALVRSERPDVVFLDIEMPGADGFSLIDDLDPAERPAVVVVSAHEHHALRAFDVDALDYLLKPFGWDRLETSLARVRDEVAQRQQRVVSSTLEDLLDDYRRQRSLDDRLPVRHNGRVSFVRLGDIDWVDAAHNRVRIQAHGASYLLRESISSDRGAARPRHLRARPSLDHRQRRQRVQELRVNDSGQYTLVLKSGQRLSVSRSHRERLRDLLGLDER